MKKIATIVKRGTYKVVFGDTPLTLFTPAYFGISGTRGGHIVPPLSILGLGGVRVPILFGNDLPMND